jgi:subtilisin family serine protease
VGLAALVLGAGTGAAAPGPPAHDGPAAIIVTLRAQVPQRAYAGRPRALVRALQSTAEHSQRPLLSRLSARARPLWIVNAVALRATPDEIRRLAHDPAVARIDHDAQVRVLAPDPQSQAFAPPPLFGGGDWGLAAIRAPEVWRDYGLDGTGVRVGVIDTGVDAAHPDLLGKVLAWRDFVNERPGPYDDQGHGTHVAGTIAGGSASGLPVGVAPGARLVVAKALDRDGQASVSTLLAAAQWMTDPDGNPATADFPSVVNASWGAPDDPASDALRPLLRRWRELGILPVFAAGNSGPRGTVSVPAAWPEAFAVGALGPGGRVARFSSRGSRAMQEAGTGAPSLKPDVAAPGLGIVSALPGGGYVAHGGTSMAAPHVAGVAALLRQAAPGLSVAAVEAVLRRSAEDVEAPGPDRRSGAGGVDAQAALTALRGPVESPPGLRVIALPSRVTKARVLTYAVASSGPVAVWLDGERVPGAQAGPLVRVTVVRPGAHAIALAPIGENGVPLTPPQRFGVTIDRTPPTVRLSVRRLGLLDIAYRALARDGVAGIAADAVRSRTPDGGSRWGGAAGRHAFSGPGPYWIELEARDRAGNVRRVRRVVVWPAAAVGRRLAWNEAFATMSMPFFNARLRRRMDGRYDAAGHLARFLQANAPYQAFVALRRPSDALAPGVVGVYSDGRRRLQLSVEISGRRYFIADQDGRVARGVSPSGTGTAVEDRGEAR